MDAAQLSAQELIDHLPSVASSALLVNWLQAQQEPGEIRKLLSWARQGDQGRDRRQIQTLIACHGRGLTPELCEELIAEAGSYGEKLLQNPFLDTQDVRELMTRMVEKIQNFDSVHTLELQRPFEVLFQCLYQGYTLPDSVRNTLMKWVNRAGNPFFIHRQVRDTIFMDRDEEAIAAASASLLVRDPTLDYQQLLRLVEQCGRSQYTLWALGSHPEADPEILLTLYQRVRTLRTHHARESLEDWQRALQKAETLIRQRTQQDFPEQQEFRLQRARARLEETGDKLVELVQQSQGEQQVQAFRALAHDWPEQARNVVHELEQIERAALAEALQERDPDVRRLLIRAAGQTPRPPAQR